MSIRSPSFSFDRYSQSLYPLFFRGSRLISTVVVSHIPICDLFSTVRCGCRHQGLRSENRSRHRVVTVASVGHSSSHTVAQPHELSEIGQSANYSQSSEHHFFSNRRVSNFLLVQNHSRKFSRCQVMTEMSIERWSRWDFRCSSETILEEC